MFFTRLTRPELEARNTARGVFFRTGLTVPFGGAALGVLAAAPALGVVAMMRVCATAATRGRFLAPAGPAGTEKSIFAGPARENARFFVGLSRRPD